MGASPLSVDIQVGETLHSFDFYGGMKSPIVKLPVYSTSDEKEQQILESYQGFNVSFKLSNETLMLIEEEKVSEIEVLTPIEEEKVSEIEVLTPIEEETLPEIEDVIEEEKVSEKVVKTFKTLSEAKAWINETHEIPFHRLSNSGYMTEEFEKLNYKLVIENAKNK